MMDHGEVPEKNDLAAQAPEVSGKDIADVLAGWEYESGTISVRKVSGVDGTPKLQMRLDLGLLQMETEGRPDGRKPNGADSLLDFHNARLAEFRAQNGTDLGFGLSGDECHALREEAVMYYHRYLSLFVLGEYAGVVRDTARNLRVLDLCARYASDEQDRFILEQYRPYITMMNARADASMLYQEKKYNEALRVVKRALQSIRDFFDRFGQSAAYGRSNEVKILRRFARDLQKKMPIDPMVKLKAQLNRAIKAERYEDAARLRDAIIQHSRDSSQGTQIA